MTRKDTTADLVRQACAKILAVDEEEIVDGARFVEDLEADSLDFAEIAEVLSEQGVHLVPEEIAHVRTFDDLVNLVHGHVAEAAT